MAEESYWSADVPISMPMPPKGERIVKMDGFVMTPECLAHDINVADFNKMATPTFAPENFGLDVVYEDLDAEDDPTDLEVF